MVAAWPALEASHLQRFICIWGFESHETLALEVGTRWRSPTRCAAGVYPPTCSSTNASSVSDFAATVTLLGIATTFHWTVQGYVAFAAVVL